MAVLRKCNLSILLVSANQIPNPAVSSQECSVVSCRVDIVYLVPFSKRPGGLPITVPPSATGPAKYNTKL